MTDTTLFALYDAREGAAQAAERLAAEVGLASSDITVIPQQGSASGDAGNTAFLGALENLRISDPDRQAYVEAIRRGGALLAARVEEDSAETAMDVLEKHGAVDIDDRQQAWRAEGWKGGETHETSSAAPRHGGAAEHSSITLAEEQLRVGKRAVEGGRVRVRRYVVETPVEEQVTLHDEHVSVEHRKMDRPATAADGALFEEQTVEMTGTNEEATVSKTAHVTGEVVVSKDTQERAETVRDTVRHTDVAVDDEPATGDNRAAERTSRNAG
jgi:uncharacterized protein (TIGR02271 family)